MQFVSRESIEFHKKTICISYRYILLVCVLQIYLFFLYLDISHMKCVVSRWRMCCKYRCDKSTCKYCITTSRTGHNRWVWFGEMSAKLYEAQLEEEYEIASIVEEGT